MYFVCTTNMSIVCVILNKICLSNDSWGSRTRAQREEIIALNEKKNNRKNKSVINRVLGCN